MAAISIRKDHNGKPTYYELAFKDEAGTRQRVMLGRVDVLTRKDVDDILRARQLEESTGARLLGLHLRSKRVPLFKDYALEYLVWHQGEYPASNERVAGIVHRYLVPKFGKWALDAIPVKDAEDYKRERRRAGAKDWTITKELRTLNAVLNRAVLEKLIGENPIAIVDTPKILDAKPHYFYEDEQLALLYAACSTRVNNGLGPQPDPLHAAIWKLYANTGMRRGEGMALQRKWIGREGIKIVSTGEERTKSGDWREVPKTEGAAEALDRLKSAGDRQHVLPRVTLPSVSRAFKKDAVRAEIPGSLHTLRHTYISRLMRDTATDIRTIQLWVGHATIQTTEIYLYLRTNLGNTPAARLDL